MGFVVVTLNLYILEEGMLKPSSLRSWRFIMATICYAKYKVLIKIQDSWVCTMVRDILCVTSLWLVFPLLTITIKDPYLKIKLFKPPKVVTLYYYKKRLTCSVLSSPWIQSCHSVCTARRYNGEDLHHLKIFISFAIL